jgi:hypothetical protein
MNLVAKQLGFEQGQGGSEICGRNGPGNTAEPLKPIFFELPRRTGRLANIFESAEKFFRVRKPEFTSKNLPVTAWGAF